MFKSFCMLLDVGGMDAHLYVAGLAALEFLRWKMIAGRSKLFASQVTIVVSKFNI